MKINDNLRELRMGRNLTQDQVAEKLNVTRQTVSSYESGRTRPDIDTLVRYSELFGIELESLIYGYDKELKANRRIKITAIIIFALLTTLVAVGSLFFLISHKYSIPYGMSKEEILLDYFQTKLTFQNVWMTLDNLVNLLSLLGFILLFIMLIIGKNGISVKEKLIYTSALSAALLIIPVAFGLADPLFSPQEYILTEIFVTIRLWVFLGIEEAVQLFKRKKR